MKVFNTAKFEVGIHDLSAGMPHQHGWFEHNHYGDEFGGGLWFKDNILVDYDGIAGYLPKEVLDVLESNGFNVDEMRPDHTDEAV